MQKRFTLTDGTDVSVSLERQDGSRRDWAVYHGFNRVATITRHGSSPTMTTRMTHAPDQYAVTDYIGTWDRCVIDTATAGESWRLEAEKAQEGPTVECIDCNQAVPFAWIDSTSAPKCPKNIGATGVRYGHRVPRDVAEDLREQDNHELMFPTGPEPRPIAVTPRETAALDALRAALIDRGIDYSTAQDKAFMNHDRDAEAYAKGGLEATVQALAVVLGIDPPAAEVLILTATD